MEPWQQWLAMAQESAQAAKLAEDAGLYRSAVSRYYYAAYQVAAAVLRYLDVDTPDNREAWSHEITPQLLREHLRPILRSRDKRNDLATRLEQMYHLRVEADYIASEDVEQTTVEKTGRNTRYILSIFADMLPKGQKQ